MRTALSSRQKHRHRARLFREQKGVCYYCSRPMLLAKGPGRGQSNPPNLTTLDHIVPLSKGGVLAPDTNTVAACHSCNCERGDKDARLFMLEKQGLFA